MCPNAFSVCRSHPLRYSLPSVPGSFVRQTLRHLRLRWLRRLFQGIALFCQFTENRVGFFLVFHRSQWGLIVCFFIQQRSIRRNRQYVCKAKSEGACLVDKTHRNQCRACRLRKCVEVGMNKDGNLNFFPHFNLKSILITNPYLSNIAVQHERGPRNSTLRRQMSMYYSMKGSTSSSPENNGSPDADSPPPSTGRASPLMPSGMTTPPTTMFRPPQLGTFSPPVTSTPTSSTVLSVSTSPPSSLLGCPTDNAHLSHHQQHMTLAERMSMSLLSHHARPMNLLCAPQPKVSIIADHFFLGKWYLLLTI